LQFDALQETNEKLSKDLDDARAALKKQSSELRKSSASLTSQLDATKQEKDDISRRFWNLNEDNKELNGENERLKQERDDVKKKYDEIRIKHKKERTNSVEKEKTILLELGRVQSKLGDTVRQSSQQKEKYEEKLGGLEEAIDMLQGEVTSAEEERKGLVQKVGNLNTRLEEENDMNVQLKAEVESIVAEIKEKKCAINELNFSLEKCRYSFESQLKEERIERERQQDKYDNLEKTLDVTNQSREKEHEHNAKIIHELTTKNDESQRHIEALEDEMKSITSAHSQVSSQAQQQEAGMQTELLQLKNICDELKSKLELRLLELSSEQKKVNELSQEISNMKSDAVIQSDERERALSSIEQEKESLTNKLESYVARCHMLEQEKIDLLAESKQLQTAIQDAKNEGSQLLDTTTKQKEEKIAELAVQLRESNSACAKLTNQLEKLKNTKAKLILSEEEKKQYCDEVGSMKRHVEVLVAEREEMAKTSKIQTDQLSQMITKLKEENESLEGKVEWHAVMAEKIKVEQSELMDRLENLQKTYNEDSILKEEQIETLKDDASSSENERNELRIMLDASRIEISDQKRSLALFQAENQRLEQIAKSVDGTAKVLDEQLQHTKDENAILTKELVDVKEKMREILKEKDDFAKKSCNDDMILKNRLKELNEIVCERGNALQVQEKQFIQIEDESAEQQANLQGTIDELSIELSILKETLSREKVRNTRQMESQKKKMADYKHEKDVLSENFKTDMAEMQKQIDNYQENVCLLESEKDDLWGQLEGKRRELERTRTEVAAMKVNIKAREDRIKLRMSIPRNRMDMGNELPREYSVFSRSTIHDESQNQRKIMIKSTAIEEINGKKRDCAKADVEKSNDANCDIFEKSSEDIIETEDDQFAETAIWPMNKDNSEQKDKEDDVVEDDECYKNITDKTAKYLMQRKNKGEKNKREKGGKHHRLERVYSKPKDTRNSFSEMGENADPLFPVIHKK